MNYSLYAFLFLVLFIYSLTSYYLGNKIYNNINYSYNVNKKRFWTFFIVAGVSYIAISIVDQWLPYQLAKYAMLISSYWIVFYFYGLLFFLFFDLLHFADKKIDFLPQTLKYEKDTRALVTIITVFVIVVLAGYGTYNARTIKVVEYDAEVSKEISGEYKLALVSDIHISYQIGAERFTEMTEKINAQNPDIVLIAGDFFDNSWRTFYEEDIGRLLGNIQSEFGVYMVLGNHDNFLENRSIVKPLFEAHGITVLKDESILINNELILVGRKDITEDRLRYGAEERMPLENLLRNINHRKAVILMDHSPLDIYNAHRLGVDLQVAGHTHAGQMYPFGIITERYYAFDYGHLIRGNYNLIVTSGIGTWGPPVRIGTNSEIAVITLRQKQ